MVASKFSLRIALMLVLVAPVYGQQTMKLTTNEHSAMFLALITKLKASRFYADMTVKYQANENERIIVRPLKTIDRSGELDPNVEYVSEKFLTLLVAEGKDTVFYPVASLEEIVQDSDRETGFQHKRGEQIHSSVKADYILRSVFTLANDSDSSTLAKTYTWRLELVHLATNSTVWGARTSKEISANLR